MDQSENRPLSKPVLIAGAIAIAALGAVGGWWLESSRGKVSASDKAAIEQVVHDYLLEHPEVLPEAVERLRTKESRKQLAGIAEQVKTPYPGAVLGNPNGKVVLVEFSDFACGFCRRSLPDVEALIAANPQLKVVIRELPVLSPASAEAARMGLAAAAQGKYEAFHHAMFAAGTPSAATIDAAARTAGLDLAKARQTLADPKIEEELRRNVQFAQALGFEGTPGWVIGDQLISGAVGKDELARAIKEATPS
jgi:protein-disulfide isomerase